MKNASSYVNDVKAAYLGIPGSYSHLAVLEHFGKKAEYVGAKNFRDIFAKVEKGEADYGIIPVENSLAGSVYDNYDLLHEHKVSVVGEHFLKINLQLLGIESAMPPEVRVEHLAKVVSHYKALEQSEGFFLKYPWIKKEVFSDTANAAKFVADQKDPLMAAIASKETAEIYGLKTIMENVHDNPHNYTRFLIIGKKENPIKGSNKCSIIFTVLHEAGSLVRALKVLSENGINLIKIESRPIHGKPFEYLFYVDFGWPKEKESHIDRILEEFKNNTQTLKVLGFYKAGTIIDP
jgi:prephenate dehydratase